MTRRRHLPAADPSWAYFLDIDGTLVHLATTPDTVRVSIELRQDIRALHTRTGGAVALITGRSLADVDRLFPDLHLAAAGQHGLERRGATGEVTRVPGSSRHLDAARRTLADAVARHPGLVLEDKGLSLALHYRLVPRLGGYAHRLVRAQLPRLGRRFGIRPGKRVVELGPAARNKGTAIQEFMLEPPFQGRVPVFLGDDITDEHGFATVQALGGYAIKVGPGRTGAGWRLPDVAAVHDWLQRSPVPGGSP